MDPASLALGIASAVSSVPPRLFAFSVLFSVLRSPGGSRNGHCRVRDHAACADHPLRRRRHQGSRAGHCQHDHWYPPPGNGAGRSPGRASRAWAGSGHQARTLASSRQPFGPSTPGRCESYRARYGFLPINPNSLSWMLAFSDTFTSGPKVSGPRNPSIWGAKAA